MTKKEETAIANTAGTDLDLSQFGGLDSGFEGTSNETFKTPFMKILQKISPEVDDTDPSYIPGAKAGMFLNTATKEFKSVLKVVVLKMEHNLIVWAPDRGGLVGVFDKSEENQIVAKREGPFKWDKDGNEIDDTISFYMMNPEDATDVFILPVSRSSFKHGQSFATRMRALKLNNQLVKRSWAGIWDISLMMEENSKGKWYSMGSTPTFVEFVTPDLINGSIAPALELLKTAETNFDEMKETSSTSDETVEHENF